MESELLFFVLVLLCFAALPESIPRVLLLPATLAVLGEQWHDPSHSKCRRSCCLTIPVSSLTPQIHQTCQLITALSSDLWHIQTGPLGWSTFLNKCLWQLKINVFLTPMTSLLHIKKNSYTLEVIKSFAYISLEYTRKEKKNIHRKGTELEVFLNKKTQNNKTNCITLIFVVVLSILFCQM